MPEVVADIRTRAEGAMLATSAGDALGWPQEDRNRRVGAMTEQLDDAELQTAFQQSSACQQLSSSS